jgi:hypothetical protein
MDVSGCSAHSRADEQRDTDGEVVWSWPPGAEAKFAALDERAAMGARKPVPRESAYKP